MVGPRRFDVSGSCHPLRHRYRGPAVQGRQDQLVGRCLRLRHVLYSVSGLAGTSSRCGGQESSRLQFLPFERDWHSDVHERWYPLRFTLYPQNEAQWLRSGKLCSNTHWAKIPQVIQKFPCRYLNSKIPGVASGISGKDLFAPNFSHLFKFAITMCDLDKWFQFLNSAFLSINSSNPDLTSFMARA